jgi:periplasmic divalent cation tolerance protein
MDKRMKYIIVFVTAPKRETKKIINILLTKKLVACVNEIKNIDSYYWWENKICVDKESLLIIKTKKMLFKKLLQEIKKVHPYKVPEVISVDIKNGNKEYFDWINSVTL